MTGSPDIFLSYNREDAEAARWFAQGFEAEGFEVWWDQALHSGEDYDEVTENALNGAKAVVVLWSPRSVVSRWVRAEATVAERNGTLVPVSIEDCRRPVMFELKQTSDLSHWQGDADDPGWRALLADVGRMVGMEPTASIGRPGPATALVENKLPFVAIIPFSHRGGGEDMEFLVEDLFEEVTRQLAQRPFFEVIGASKMASWRGRSIDHDALKRELGARYLIEGKLQSAGETVRLTVQLLDADTAKMVWSTRIAQNLSEVTSSPENFAAAVATQLGENIIQNEQTRAMAKPGPHSAWEHMLRARAYVGRHGLDNARNCMTEVRKAVEADPDNAFAHAFMASQIADQAWNLGARIDADQIQEVRRHMKRAAQLDGGENPAVLTMLVSAYHGLGEYENSLRIARRSLDLYPNYMASLQHVGLSLLFLGRTAEAITYLLQEDQHSPFNIMRYAVLAELGICYLLEGQPEDAEEALDRSLALNPDYPVALKWKAIAVGLREDQVEGKVAIQRLRDAEPEMSIEQHVWQIVRSPKLAERTQEHVATLRRLWAETEPAA